MVADGLVPGARLASITRPSRRAGKGVTVRAPARDGESDAVEYHVKASTHHPPSREEALCP